MRLLTYRHQGRATYGVVAGDGVVDIGRRLGDKYPSIRAVLEAGALAEVAKAADSQPADAALSAIEYLPVIPAPGKILMVGVNYHAHREEVGRAETGHPTFFVRFPESQIGHEQPMIRPKESDKLDYEGELAVIIGKGGRRIPKARALEHVVGYSCYNDGSVRDWQRHTTQWTPGKNFVGTGPFGPWMVTADELGDPSKLRLTTRLNGEVMQDSTTDLLIFDIPTLIEYASAWVLLKPGDVIVSGTPGGVGFARKPQLFMKPGDTVEVEITGIGALRNKIVGEE